MKNVYLTLLLVLGCGVPEKRYPPVAGDEDPTAVTSTSSDTSTTTASIDDCAAYIGCMKQCKEGDCVAQCADATGSDADACEQVRCDDLISACAVGDETACTDVLSCVHSASSETTVSTSSSSSSTETSDGSSTSESTGATTEGSTGSEETSTSDSSSTT